MATTSEIHSKNFNDNNSFRVNTLSTLLSGIETKANINLIPTIYITQALRQVSLIYKYIYIAIKEGKAYIKKCYFYKYYPL